MGIRLSAASQALSWRRFAKRALPALGAGALPFLLLSYSGGPPARRTGAPGDRTCLDAGCHVGERFEASAELSLDTGGSAAYVPGGPPQRWILRNSDRAARAYGMQLSVRAASNPAAVPAGDLRSIDATTSVVCEDGRFKGDGACLPSAPVQFIHHTAPRREGIFEFEWTPPATALGDIEVYVASNASVAGQRNSRIHLRSFRLTPRVGTTVVSAAPGQTMIAPGSWITVFGTNLSGSARSWREADFRDGALPESLDGVRVTVDGKPAFVAFVSPSQINALAPDGIVPGEVRVEVTRDGNPVALAVARADRVAPAFFVAQPLSARPGETVTLYGTGFGPTEPAVPTGRLFSAPAPCASPVSIRVGGEGAEVRFAGLVAPGLYRVNFVVPGLAPGDHAVEADVGGHKTPSGVVLRAVR